MTSKHIPGPWECNVGATSDAEYLVWKKGGNYLTTNQKEHLANARLIAAAPELYEALREMVRSHDLSCPGESCRITGVDMARAVLAKVDNE